MSGRIHSGSFWPSATQRALLQVGLGPVEQVAARWKALQPLDLTKLETGSFGLLPLLYERLRDAVPDEPQLPRLFGTYRSVWYRNQLLQERLAVLVPLLRQRARARPILVGGMSALLRWFPRLGLRPVPELDLIVEPDTAAEAVKVSRYAGWEVAGRRGAATVLRDRSGHVLVIHSGEPPASLGPPGEGSFAALCEGASELDCVEGSPLVLDPADELLLICAAGARTAVVQTCQWLIDADRLLHSDAAPSELALLEKARRAHLVAPVRASLHYLAQVVGDDVLHRYDTAFAAESVSTRDRLAFGLAGVRGSRRAGMAQVAATYLQATADDSPFRAVARLPRHFQRRWGIQSLAGVPMVALRKALRLLLPQTRRSPTDRNRPASS